MPMSVAFSMLAAAAANLLLLTAGFGAGFVVSRAIPADCGRGEAVAIRLLMGLGLLALVLFVVGTFIFTLPIIGAILGIAIIPLFWSVRTPGSKPLAIDAIEQGRWRAMRYLVIGFLLVLALAGLSQPIGNSGFDTVAYHLLGPKVWLRNGRIGPVLDHSHTAFPATFETLYAVLLALSGSRSIGLFDAELTALFLILVHGLTVRLSGDRKAAILAVAAVIAMPTIAIFTDNGFVDVPFAAVSIAAVRVAFDIRSINQAALAGLAAGIAAGTKYTGLFVIGVTATMIGVVELQRFSVGKFRFTTIFLLVGVVVACPWYLRNWVVLGSPIYPAPPLLNRFCVTPFMPPDATRRFHDYIRERGIGLGRTPLDLLALPVTFTLRTNLFSGAGGIGLIPLGFFPAAFWRLRRNRFARWLIVWSCALTVIWFYTQQEARFAIGMVAILTTVAAVAASDAVAQSKAFGRCVAIAVIAVSIVYGIAFTIKNKLPWIRAAIRPAYAAQLLAREVPFCAAFDFLNQTPSVQKTMILNPDVPPYYLDKPYLKVMGGFGEEPLGRPIAVEDVPALCKQFDVTDVLDVATPGEPLKLSGYSEPAWDIVFQTKNAVIYHVR